MSEKVIRLIAPGIRDPSEIDYACRVLGIYHYEKKHHEYLSGHSVWVVEGKYTEDGYIRLHRES